MLLQSKPDITAEYIELPIMLDNKLYKTQYSEYLQYSKCQSKITITKKKALN